MLSVFQISVPELGTLKANHIPYVILTSNRTRELSDALKRRCLYHWIDYPSVEKELTIVQKRIPGIENKLATQIVHFIQAMREMKLSNPPGVVETLDWAMALLALDTEELSSASVERTLGCILKSTEDIELVRSEGVANLLEA
ncbi:MAG: hypothetical protein E2O79_10375 [Caldithrix sp.]|nr:MAG: hypothetical protein E2O79_10375 [Caldithrix sp.]